MSETVVNSTMEKPLNDLVNDGQNKQDQPATTNNVANDSKVQQQTKEETPGKRRKRGSEVSDSSLVLETPPGADSNRRQTRSQTRGTPPVMSSPPAKKIALDKSIASNGSVNKGRRGRPPKNAITATDSEEMKVDPVKSEENPENKEDKNEQVVPTSSPPPAQLPQEQKQQNEDKVDGKPKSLVNETVSSTVKENCEVIKSEENEKKPELPTVVVSELKKESSPTKPTITGTAAATTTTASPINTTASPKSNKPVSPSPISSSAPAPAPAPVASTPMVVTSAAPAPAPAPPIMIATGLDKKQN